MAAMRNFSVAFSLVEVISEPLGLDTLNLVQTYIESK